MEKRDIQVKFRVTATEKSLIDEKMKKAGIHNMGAYLRKMAIDGYLINMDLGDIRQVIRLLRYSSNNLNQYAKRANETGSIYQADIKELRQQHEKMWEMMREILERLRSVQN